MGKRFQFVILVLHTFINRHKRFILLGFLIGFFLTLLTIQFFPFYTEMTGIKEKKIAYIGKYNENNLPLSVQNLLSLGLTRLTSSGEASPSLALAWKTDANGLVYLFSFARDIYWQNGEKFKASDVNYKLKDVTLTPLDEYTLKVTLKEPFSPLPVLFSKPLFKQNLTGLGLYKVTGIRYQEDYISELRLEPVKKSLPLIIYKFYPSADEAMLAYKMGEVNIIDNISHIGDLLKWKNTKITKVTLYDRLVGVFFNLKNPLFKEKEVRQALTYAVPKIDDFEKAYTPVSPLSWAYSTNIRLYKYDTEAAKKILSKNPVSSSSSELILLTFSSLIDTAQKIADNWSRAGVNTKVRAVSSIPPDYQAIVLTLSIPPDPDQYQYWQSTQDNTNITHYSNLKIDKLLEDGRKTYDQDKRKKIYADFQRYLVDDAPAIFLYHPDVYVVERR